MASLLTPRIESLSALKILHIAAPVVAGGLERVVEALAVGHHRRGHQVAVAAIVQQAGAEHPVVVALRAAGVVVHLVAAPRRAYLRERRAIAALCRSFRPDIVHTHGYRTDVVDRGVATRLGIPTVTTVHGPSLTGGLKGAFYEWMQRRNYRRFDAVVAVSTALANTTLADGVAADRLYCVPNAWGGLRSPLSREEARHTLGLPADGPVVGWVGRMIPVKGGDLFLDAVHLLPEPRPLIVMIGYGAQAETLRRQADAAGIGEIVRFFPDVTDAGRLFSAFDTYVLSSRSEGLPIVILEAMASGTPVVATRVGGVTDVVSEESGWLVATDDAWAMARAIAESLQNRAMARARAANATRRLAADFALEPWLKRYEEVYQRVSASRNRPSATGSGGWDPAARKRP